MLNLVKRCSEIEGVSPVGCKRDFPEDRNLNRKLAADGVILRKNDPNVLPLPAGIEEIALIGPNMKNAAYCGGGSAQLESYYIINNHQGIADQLTQDGQRKNVKILYKISAHACGLLPMLDESVTTSGGQSRRLRMRFFSEPPIHPTREFHDELEPYDSAWQLMG